MSKGRGPLDSAEYTAVFPRNTIELSGTFAPRGF